MASNIRALLLCGGRSTRFGADKLLAQWQGAPLVVAAAANLLKSGGGAIAVMPPGNGELRRVLEHAGCEILETERTTRGLRILRASALAKIPWLVHGFSTRPGGVSELQGEKVLEAVRKLLG